MNEPDRPTLRRGLRAQRRAALVTFVMAGDPDPALSLEISRGWPRRAPTSSKSACRSPIRWPTVRRSRPAGLRALQRRHDAQRRVDAGRRFPRDDAETPIILMGYYNPIYVYGVDKFLVDAKAAGVDGMIVVDLPPEEDEELCLPALQAGLELHPAGDADHRRRPPADGSRQHLGLRLLRLDHRHHRRRAAGLFRVAAAVKRIKGHTPAGRRRLRGQGRRGGAGNRRATPMASWSARP